MLHHAFICELQIPVGQPSPPSLQLPPRIPAQRSGVRGGAFRIAGPGEMASSVIYSAQFAEHPLLCQAPEMERCIG